MLNTYVEQEIARAGRNGIERDAEQRRLVKEAREGQPGLAEKLGGLLVKAGERLQRRESPRPSTEPGWVAE